MRFIQTIALTGLTLLFAASSANAWQVRMESTSAGGNIAVGDKVTVTVDLNTDGGTDLFALGVGVLFEGLEKHKRVELVHEVGRGGCCG